MQQYPEDRRGLAMMGSTGLSSTSGVGGSGLGGGGGGGAGFSGFSNLGGGSFSHSSISSASFGWYLRTCASIVRLQLHKHKTIKPISLTKYSTFYHRVQQSVVTKYRVAIIASKWELGFQNLNSRFQYSSCSPKMKSTCLLCLKSKQLRRKLKNFQKNTKVKCFVELITPSISVYD